MAAITRDIVKAIAKEISQHNFDCEIGFDVVTPLLPRWTKDELKTVKVCVISRAMQIEPVDRSRSEWMIEIDVAVQHHLESVRKSERDSRVEQLCGFIEDIAVFLRNAELSDVPAAQFESCNIEPLYDPSYLEDNVFTGRVAAKYRILTNG